MVLTWNVFELIYSKSNTKDLPADFVFAFLARGTLIHGGSVPLYQGLIAPEQVLNIYNIYTTTEKLRHDENYR